MGANDRLTTDGPLSISVRHRRDATVVVLRGELDLANVATVERELEEALHDGAEGTVVLDMEGLELIDSTGIAFLVRAASLDDGRRIRFLPSRSPAVSRVLGVTGVDGWLSAANGHASGAP